jgi:hypothetical protein
VEALDPLRREQQVAIALEQPDPVAVVLHVEERIGAETADLLEHHHALPEAGELP